MAYTSRHSGRTLTAEEADVAASLRSYATAGASEQDWTPTAALWRSYRDWWGLNRWRIDPDLPARLTVRQFGRAVRRIFAGACRRKRSFHGKPQWGYSRLSGPESVSTPLPKGQKKKPARV